MGTHFRRARSFWLLAVALLVTVVLRTLLAVNNRPPRLDDLFLALALLGSLAAVGAGHRTLRRNDWLIALVLSGTVALGMFFVTLFSPYPLWGIVHSRLGQGVARGAVTLVGALGGLVLMRQGGPVRVSAAAGRWRKVAASLALGLAAGLPLAVLNVFALHLTSGQPIAWQSPLAAGVDAWQPAVVEEVVYRFATLSLFCLALRRSQPRRAAWLAGLLALLAHTVIHFDDLLVQAPFAALGLGAVTVLLWGLPLTVLALRRDLESAIAFHWIQDAARFLAGF